MNQYRSYITLLLVSSLVVAAGIACSGSNTSTTNTSTINTAGNNSTGAVNTSTANSASPPKSIAGEYDASGTNPDGAGKYEAKLKVTPRDDVYQFSWTSGKNSYDGVGVMTDGEVAVSYTDGDNGKGCGVVLYKISPDGSLDGKAGYWGTNTMESEKGIRKSGSGADLDGVYTVIGKNPEGKEYKGELTIAQSGDGYSFTWNTGNSFLGFGVKAGNYVAVGFGGKQCSFVGYDVQPDGTLDGKWGGQGMTKFGTEVAKKVK